MLVRRGLKEAACRSGRSRNSAIDAGRLGSTESERLEFSAPQHPRRSHKDPDEDSDAQRQIPEP
jgi:hypothetical protein